MRPVTGLSAGWSEGLELMVVGEKRTLWVPAALAAQGRPGSTPSDATMWSSCSRCPAPKVPADVKAPPKDAVLESDGLATKVLTKGTGRSPHPVQRCDCAEYAGWTNRRQDVRLVVHAR